MSTLRRGFPIKDALETVDHSLVVHEDVNRSLRTRSEMDNGESFGYLGILSMPWTLAL